MKSALATRLVLTIGLGAIALFIFIGINVGYELPSDRTLWFGGALAVAGLLIAYGWYAARKPKRSSAEAESTNVTRHAP